MILWCGFCPPSPLGYFAWRTWRTIRELDGNMVRNTLRTRKKNAPILPNPTPKLKRKNLRPLHVCWGFSLTIRGKTPKAFITIFNLIYFLYCKVRYIFIHSKREWGLKEIKENYSSFLKGKKIVVKLTKLFTNSKEKN